MADPFTGEIRIFCGTFVPYGWAACNGASLQISQHNVLYAIIGVVYGGDGRTTFNLPNLNGVALVHQGQGPGLTNRTLGTPGGVATVTLNSNQMPVHRHVPMALDGIGNATVPTNAAWSKNMVGGRTPSTSPQFAALATTAPPNSALNPQALGVTGGNQPHNNMQPYLPLQYIICLNGEFPSRQ